MRLEQLTYFVKTADTGSFSSASMELFISQQALSTSIKNLEKEFQAQLLIRTPKGVVLSNDGKYFYEIATQILALSQQLQQHFYPEPILPTSTLTIALNVKQKNHFFPKIISYFYKEYPQLNIIYNLVDNKEIINLLLTDKANMGVMSLLNINKNRLLSLPDNIYFIPFDISDYALMTNIHSPLAQLQTISMETIIKYPIILNATRNFTSDLFYQLIMMYAVDPNLIWTDSDTLQIQMVEDNIGNMLFVKKNPLPSNTVCKIPITNKILIETGFLIRSDQLLDPLCKHFIEKTKTIVAENF